MIACCEIRPYIYYWLYLMLQAPRAAPADVAQFIERMTAELQSLAAQSDLSILAYLLAVARAEAGEQARPRSHRRETSPPG